MTFSGRLGYSTITAFTLVSIGCTNPDRDSVDLVDAEENSLGIAQIEIARGQQGDDSLLEVRGLGTGGEEIASATLRTGMFTYVYDADVSLEPVWVEGHQLRIEVGSRSDDAAIPNLLPQGVPVPDDTLAAFVRLAAVGKVFEDVAGLHFKTRETAGESAYLVGLCSTGRFTTNLPNPIYCCEDSVGPTIWHKIGTGASNPLKLAAGTYGVPCSNDGVNQTNCGATCAHGPAGRKGSAGWPKGDGNDSDGDIAVVFHPTSDPFNTCGWKEDAGGTFNPENYTTQQLYNNHVNNVNYSKCGDVAGNPGPGNDLALTATSTNFPTYSGTAVATAANISHTGTGSVTKVAVGANVTVTVTPEPDTSARITGACSSALGLMGVPVQCSYTNNSSATAKSITVNYRSGLL